MSLKHSYLIIGLIIGMLLGSFAGLGESRYTKESQRGTIIPILAIGGAILGGAVGASFGYNLGKKIHIEEITGISKASLNLFQVGRYWTAVTIWSDTRNPDYVYKLNTSRVTQGIIQSTLNGKVFITHNTNSASQVNINKYHKEAQRMIFEKTISIFNEDSVTEIEKIIA